jgi:hypothetical protein
MSEHGAHESSGDRITVFFGELSPQLAHIYARVLGSEAGRGGELRGTVTGPWNQFTRTLTTTAVFRQLEPGQGLLARAWMPDPCFWAPGEPYLYTVRIELVVDGVPVVRVERQLGLKRLGVHQQQLLLNAQPWRLRAVQVSPAEDLQWDPWRQQGLVCCLEDPPCSVCAQASREGVLLLARVDRHAASPPWLTDELRRLARHAAVAVVAVKDPAALSADARREFPNLLLAQEFDGPPPERLAPWADLAVCTARDDLAGVTSRAFPVLLRQPRRDRRLATEAGNGLELKTQQAGAADRFAGWIS